MVRDFAPSGTERAQKPLSFQSDAIGRTAAWRPIVGELKDKAKGIANEAVGETKQRSGDPETRAEGRAQERKGEAQNLKGKVKGALGNKI